MRFPTPCLFVCFLALAAGARAEVAPPMASTTLKSGAALTAIAAPDSPWAVALLTARVPDLALSPDERALLGPLAQALAQGRTAAQPGGLDPAAFGGAVKARVDADTLAIAVGAPADRVDDAVRALDARLKARRALMPAQGAAPALPSASPALPDDVVALAAPSHPDALPVDAARSTPIEPKVLRDLAERVLAGGLVRVVVLGPRAAPELLASAERMLSSPLPPGAPPAIAPHVAREQTVVREARVEGPATSSRVYLWCADDDAHARAAAHAAVLAALLGGALSWTDDAVAIGVDVQVERASLAPRAEGRVLERIAQLAAAAPPDDAVARAKEQVRAARLALLKDPEALALTVARAKDAGALEAGLAAIDATTPDDVRAVARRCATGPRVIVRALGGAR